MAVRRTLDLGPDILCHRRGVCPPALLAAFNLMQSEEYPFHSWASNSLAFAVPLAAFPTWLLPRSFSQRVAEQKQKTKLQLRGCSQCAQNTFFLNSSQGRSYDTVRSYWVSGEAGRVVEVGTGPSPAVQNVQ